MLTKLHIKHFKAWRDTTEIRLAPITVFFGTNSAGKSSIAQLLLLLKQTAESPDRQRTLNLGDSRTLVDAGTYKDIVHRHDVANDVSFAFSWNLTEPLEVKDSRTDTTLSGNEIDFSAAIGQDDKGQPRTKTFCYQLRDGSETRVAVTLNETASPRNAGRREFDLSTRHFQLTRTPGRAWPLPAPSRFYGFPEEVAAYYQNAAFTSDFVLELERALRSLYHVGPLREHPKRLYLWAGERPDHVGGKGERTIEAILAAGTRKIKLKGKQYKSFEHTIAERLKSMGLISDFQVKDLGDKRNYEVLIKTSNDRPAVKLTDVGFGVSQVLPVIVECFYVNPGSTVVFEQPEIHLHPRVQADLANLFVDAIHATENKKTRNCQFIIESHSEHFLRRLQRLIAEQKLSAQDAALYFVSTNGSEARLEELQMDDFGNITNWPEDFFGDEMEDLVARREAQARRTQPGK